MMDVYYILEKLKAQCTREGVVSVGCKEKIVDKPGTLKV